MAKERSIDFGDLHTQLKIISKLLAAQAKERLQQQDLVRILMTTGASDQELADVLGTTAATVAATKVRLKRRAKASTEKGDE